MQQSPSLHTSPLNMVIVEEMAARRTEVLAVDPRLAGLLDRLVEFVLDGGKRLRPEFLLCGWRAAGGGDVPAPVLRVGAALELLQACALLHDDIMDRSDIRRGRPTIQRAVAKEHADTGLAGESEHFGLSAALLLGDMALAWSDDLYLEGAADLDRVRPTAPVWRAMRTEVLAGQMLDLRVTADPTVDPVAQADDAMAVNRWKTAAYTVERPLYLGAALAGGSPACIRALRAYGADIGVAFQLRDDLLGVFGDPAVTGKPAGDDLTEGKRTLLVAAARAALSPTPDLLAELDAGLGTAGADVSRLATIIADTGAPAHLEEQITALAISGVAALEATEPGGGPAVSAAARERLTELAAAATARVR